MGIARRVLVTRPQPGASATAARLRAMGHHPVLLPLTRIVALPAGDISVEGYDAAVFTSANGVRHSPAGLVPAIGGRPVYCVGEATAEAARAAGYRHARIAAGDAAALAARMADGLPAGCRVLHLAGRDRTQGFREALAAAGIALDVVEVYRAEPVMRDDGAVRAALGGEPVDAALVFSPRAGRLLTGAMRHPAMRPALAHAAFVCISANAAAAVAGIADGRIAIAATPDETAMLACLSALD